MGITSEWERVLETEFITKEERMRRRSEKVKQLEIQGKKVTVTDLITWEDVKGFMPEVPVFISAGTGRGKSHFIKHVLYKDVSERREKILLIVNRSNVSEQFRGELEALSRSNVVDVRTYQSLESLNEKERREILCDLEEYDYLVMDECQYFLDDAAFNNTTDISLDLIMRAVDPKKIFMSATGKRVKALIEKLYSVEFEYYEIPDDFSHIQTLNFFNTYDDMEMKLEEIIKRGEKSIVFIQKAETAYKLAEKLGDTAQFCCAKSNKHYQYVEEEKKNEMLRRECFDSSVLVTTACLDTGINIKDRDVKHIFVDLKDVSSVIQAIGRKRTLDEHDRVNVYIKILHQKEIEDLIKSLEKKIEMSSYLMEHTETEYIEHFARRSDGYGIVYDDITGGKLTKKINKMMHSNAWYQIKDLKDILKYKEYGFCKFWAEKFGKYDKETKEYKYSVVARNKKQIENYLEELNETGCKFYEEKERRAFFEQVGLKNKKDKLITNVDVVNEYLKSLSSEYRVRKFRSSRSQNGKIKSYNAAIEIIKAEK